MLKKEVETSLTTLRKIYEHDSNNRCAKRDLLKLRALKKSRCWAWFFSILAVSLFLCMIGLGIIQALFDCEFAKTLETILNSKLVYFGLTGILGLINCAVFAHLYQCYYNSSTIAKIKDDVNIPNDLKDITFEEFKDSYK